jgi:hypothetical protein
MREGGDTLVVWKLDRLARSLKQLIETVEAFGRRGIGLRSLTEAIDTSSTGTNPGPRIVSTDDALRCSCCRQANSWLACSP